MPAFLPAANPETGVKNSGELRRIVLEGTHQIPDFIGDLSAKALASSAGPKGVKVAARPLLFNRDACASIGCSEFRPVCQQPCQSRCHCGAIRQHCGTIGNYGLTRKRPAALAS
jgi:hypothetical protein